MQVDISIMNRKRRHPNCFIATWHFEGGPVASVWYCRWRQSCHHNDLFVSMHPNQWICDIYLIAIWPETYWATSNISIQAPLRPSRSTTHCIEKVPVPGPVSDGSYGVLHVPTHDVRAMRLLALMIIPPVTGKPMAGGQLVEKSKGKW